MEKKLTDLLTNKEINEVTKMLNKGEDKKLREYLRKRKKSLEAKGVLPDYLFYYLKFVKMRLRKVV